MATTMMPAVMTEYIPGLVGIEGLVADRLVHLAVAGTFGVGFAAIVTETGFVDHAPSFTWDVGIGLGHGAVVWLVAMAIVMPSWLGTLNTASLTHPWLDPMTLIGHLVYGMVLGVVDDRRSR